MDNDQLCILMQSDNPLFTIYQEPPINFLPSYKFDTGTDQYDTSGKKRVPSWCDRILIWTNKKIKSHQPMFYSTKNILESDHKPVVAYYKVNFEEIQDELDQEQVFHDKYFGITQELAQSKYVEGRYNQKEIGHINKQNFILQAIVQGVQIRDTKVFHESINFQSALLQ